jgi:L-asparaginase/Glu-tRNA(Gln) amidotransferase subunit D
MDDRLFLGARRHEDEQHESRDLSAPSAGRWLWSIRRVLSIEVARRASDSAVRHRNVKELPRVDIIYSYAGADSVAIDAVVAAGAKGLVIAGWDAAAMTGSQSAAVRRAERRESSS